LTGTIIVGAQWGDEGKGKIVDFLAGDYDIVVRFNGGNNTGHTVVYNGKKYRQHLIPSGILYKGKRLLIGSGEVINPEALFQEISILEKEGIKLNLMIDGKAHVVFPFHILQDCLSDVAQGKFSAGSTRTGIAPVYSDKAARNGIRIIDLTDEEIFNEKFNNLLKLKQLTLKFVYGDNTVIDGEALRQKYLEFGKRLLPMIGDVSLEVNKALDEGKRVLFEGAQGTMLCLDHGLYPYGTSSNTIAGGACTGVGVGPTKISEVIGVTKAYTSRVGSGPLPTELKDELGNMIREKGQEYGTTTGRPRRVGWLDLVTLKYASRVNGLTSFAVTKLDILGGLRKLKVCIGYKVGNETIKEHPSDLRVFSKCEPIYKEVDGWKDLTEDEWRQIAKEGYQSLPMELKNYLKLIEDEVGVPVKIISFGPSREFTILK